MIARFIRTYIFLYYDLWFYGPMDRRGTDFYRKMKLANRLLWIVTVCFYELERRLNGFGMYKHKLPCEKPGYTRYTYKHWCPRIPEDWMYPIRRVRHWLEIKSCGY
jgi:hypothetical protein